jgi:hypothetical protein
MDTVTPAEHAVIEAATAHVDNASYCDGPGDLIRALNALKAEREAPATVESDRTWGEVVTTDEIFSTKTGKWYDVIEVRRHGDRVVVHAKGLPKMIKPLAADPVRVRRHLMGRTVDMINSILTSGPSMTGLETTTTPSSSEGGDAR